MESINIIEKENLHEVHFSKSEVLNEINLIQKRRFNLYRALIVGNVEHTKATIIFKSEEHYFFKVVATIWAVTEDFILLKGGRSIPVRAIVDLDY